MTTHGTPDPSDPLHDARERALAEFVKPGPLPESARLAEAEAHLLAELERELGVTIEPPTGVPARTVADRPGGGARGWFARLVAQPLRPALAVAAALAVVTTMWIQLGPAHRDSAPIMRGPMPGDPAAGWDARPEVAPMSGGRAGWLDPAPSDALRGRVPRRRPVRGRARRRRRRPADLRLTRSHGTAAATRCGASPTPS
jgi:hypothetical protein